MKDLRTIAPVVWKLARSRVGMLVVALVCTMVGRAIALVPPLSSRFLIDEVIGQRNVDMLLPLVGVILLAGLSQALLTLVSNRIMFSEGFRVVAGIRARIQEHVGRLPVAFFDARTSGHLARQMVEDASGARFLFGPQLLELFGMALSAVFGFVALLRISPTLTLSLLVAVGVFAIVANRGYRRIRPLYKDTMEISGRLLGRLVESIGGVRVIKGYAAEAFEANVFAEMLERQFAAMRRTFYATSLMSAIGPAAIAVLIAGITYMAARQILAGSLTIGELVSYMALMPLMVAPILQLSQLAGMLAEAAAGLARAQELLRERPEDDNPKRVHAMGPLAGAIVFEQVGFAYPAREGDERMEVLEDINFEARPGTSVALVGPSGAGKSTIIGLVAAFYEPSSGTVRVDGVDLSTVRLDSFRSQLGVVFQDTFLFDGTIRANVQFARPAASEAAILDACRMAHVHEFAERFPDGYDTVIGERGVRLSMGQRQRVAIARAILADPRILILDEATSSLDSESEAAIQDALAYLMKGRTTLMIAHRLSTIRNADQILLLEHGRITERGTHDELYARRGRYFDLSTRQFRASSEAPNALPV